jgi:competence protein ComEA
MIKGLLTALILICGLYNINVIAAEKMQESMPKVNVNTASVEELSINLYGVGEATAKAIVKYRKEHGKFKNVDDLDKVKNIGRRVLEKNKDIFVFE